MNDPPVPVDVDALTEPGDFWASILNSQLNEILDERLALRAEIGRLRAENERLKNAGRW